MGYFDGLTDGSFKKDSLGRTLFYPWGSWSSGVIIETEEKKEQIRNLLKNGYLVALPGGIVFLFLFDFWGGLGVCVIFCVWFNIVFANITRGLPRTAEKLKMSDVIKNSAQSHNLPILVFLLFGSIGFVLIGIWILIVGSNQLLIFSGIGFFGLGVILLSRMIYIKLKS